MPAGLEHGTVIYIEAAFLCAILILFTWRRVTLDMRNVEGRCLRHFYAYTFLAIISDVAWVLGEAIEGFPSWAIVFFALCHYVFQDCLAFYWLRYTDLRCDPELVETVRYKIISLIPLQIVSVLLAASLFTGWIFRIDASGHVVDGEYWYVQHIVYYWYLISSCVDACIRAGREKDEQKKTLLSNLSTFIIAPAVCGVLMIFIDGTPLMDIGYTISAVAIYLNVQSREHAEKEKIRMEKLRQETVFFSLNNNYRDVSVVDLDTERTLDYHVSGDMEKKLPLRGNDLDFEGHVMQFARMVVHPDDRKAYVKNMSKDVIRRELETSDAYYVKYRAVIDGKTGYYKTKICRWRGDTSSAGEDGDVSANHPGAVVIGVRNADSEVGRELEYQHKLETQVERRTAQLKRKNEELRRKSDEVIELLGNVVEARDAESGKHVNRVKSFTRIIAGGVMREYPEYGLDGEDAELIARASVLHDVGKILIPDAILLKDGPLTDEEFEIMKTHCAKGCEILANAPKSWGENYLRYSTEICRSHHERYDGNGYPDGLSGDNIPISAQIVSLADCYDALIYERRYKPAIDSETAYGMIMNGSCGAFSPKLLGILTGCREQIEKLAAEIK